MFEPHPARPSPDPVACPDATIPDSVGDKLSPDWRCGAPALPRSTRDQPYGPEVVEAVRVLVEGTMLTIAEIAERTAVSRAAVGRLRARGGWGRPRPARVALAGRRGGGHPIVPEVVTEARALLEGTSLSFKAVAARTGVSATTLCRWRRQGRWRRPAPPVSDRVPPPRWRRGRGRPYAADAVGAARRLVTSSLLSQAAIARQVGVSQAQISVWMRERGWARPPVPEGSRRFAAATRRGRLAETGDRRGRPYAPEARAKARTLWEDTRLSTAIIGARIGAHPVTVARWAKEEAWRRPRGRAGARQLRGFFGSQGSWPPPR